MPGPGRYLADQLKAQGYSLRPDIHFDTVPRMLVTLMQVYNQDSAFSNIQRPVGEVYPYMWLYFVGYSVIVSIGLVNLLAAIFVDSLLEEKEKREKIARDQQKRLQSEYLPASSRIFLHVCSATPHVQVRC